MFATSLANEDDCIQCTSSKNEGCQQVGITGWGCLRGLGLGGVHCQDRGRGVAREIGRAWLRASKGAPAQKPKLVPPWATYIDTDAVSLKTCSSSRVWSTNAAALVFTIASPQCTIQPVLHKQPVQLLELSEPLECKGSCDGLGPG